MSLPRDTEVLLIITLENISYKEKSKFLYLHIKDLMENSLG